MPNKRKYTQTEKKDEAEFYPGGKLLASQYGDEYNKSGNPDQDEDEAFKFTIR
jgi:hypothetical protein